MANYSLIQDSANYKTFKNYAWINVSTTLPLKSVFISDGIVDLSVFNRNSKVIVQPMTSNVTLGSGIVFKSTVNLNKYMEITNLSVK
ncbi:MULTISPECIES: hypothetical protein [Paenibacillus]|uniref:hypothetical protein n=1 Tax=Paenibacillus TaxID=44249 RepID=UPI000B86EE55|nr:hypothetical protein [Paenibacillus amylolyticus]